MLEEASPIRYVDYVSINDEFIPGRDNFIQLMNVAWRIQEKNHDLYESWETEVIETFADMPVLNSPGVDHRKAITLKMFSCSI